MPTIKLENGNEINISQESYDELAKSVDKIDYSKWVGAWYDNLCIKGEKGKQLTSTDDGEIIYEDFDEDYCEGIEFEVIKASELDFGDVFIDDDVEYSETKVENFYICVGTGNDGDVISQRLKSNYEVERIDYDYHDKSNLVKRFLRE